VDIKKTGFSYNVYQINQLTCAYKATMIQLNCK